MTIEQNRQTSRVVSKGFTLIELLVTIAIIAIIAAILFPVFAQARESARRASCLSNLKQIGLALMMYTQDYDEHFPANYAYPGGSPYLTYAAAIEPYLSNNKQVWVCPSETSTLLMGSAYAYPPFLPTDPAVSYYFNFYIGGNDVVSTGSYHRLSQADIPTPSDVFVLWEMENSRLGANFGGDTTKNAERPCDVDPCTTQADYYGGTGRHLNGDNYVYADGHVKWLARTSVPYAAGPTANRDNRFIVH